MARRRKAQCESVIALGTMTFGGQVSLKDADRMVKMFLAEGHTWIDTAFMYTDGKSERFLGRILKGRLRRKVFLATKAYPDKLGKGKPRGLTPGSVRGQIEASLRRMKTDCVDLFYLHAPDNRTPLEVTLATCNELVEEGKICELGLSNYASWQIAETVFICLQNGWKPPMIYQGMYNAITREVERECIPACKHLGVDFIAYNPLAGGLLSGKYGDRSHIPEAGRFTSEYYRSRFWKPEYFQSVASLSAPSRRARILLAEASLRWLVHHSKADGLILGASKIEHLKANLAACRKGPLSPTLRRAFDGAWDVARPVCDRYFRDKLHNPAVTRKRR